MGARRHILRGQGKREAMLDLVRCIVHLDLDAFFAAVEVIENKELEGKPILIGGRPEERGVVATASYEARAYGVRSAMPMSQAVQLCPQAIVLPSRHSLYWDYSGKVMNILHQATPLVEQVSIDEAYLDLTNKTAPPAAAQPDMWDRGIEIARELQDRVKAEIGLSASLGVATNKLVAKVASDRDKPGGLTVVRPGEEASFLAPLPVRVLWGVGPVTAARLAERQIVTVADLALVPEETLRDLFGKHGAAMARYAKGIDARPVQTEREPKSIGQERTFRRDLVDPQALKNELERMSVGVSRRLQAADVVAGTISVKLRYADFSTLTRQKRLAVPTADQGTILKVAVELWQGVWERGRAVRLLGITGQQLEPGGQERDPLPEQLALF
jgi:DNA polymerase-4